jgi:hypothetical protein
MEGKKREMETQEGRKGRREYRMEGGLSESETKKKKREKKKKKNLKKKKKKKKKRKEKKKKKEKRTFCVGCKNSGRQKGQGKKLKE